MGWTTWGEYTTDKLTQYGDPVIYNNLKYLNIDGAAIWGISSIHIPTNYYQNTGQANLNFNGSILVNLMLFKNVGSAVITSAGNVTKTTFKYLIGNLTNVIGEIIKDIGKKTGQSNVNSNGNINTSFVINKNTGNGIINTLGNIQITLYFIRNVGLAIVVPVGNTLKQITKNIGQSIIDINGYISKGINKLVGLGTENTIGELSEKYSAGIVEIGKANIQPIGILGKAIIIVKNAGGAILIPIGTVLKLINKSVGSAIMIFGSGLNKKIFINIGQAIVISIGNLIKGYIYIKNVGQSIITPTGIINTIKQTGRFLNTRLNRMFNGLKNFFH